MQRIECEWCHEENKANRTHCESCGAPLSIKDRVGDPVAQPFAAPPPPTFDMGSPVAALPFPTVRRRSPVGVLMWVAFLIIVVGAGIGVAAMAHKNNHARSTSSATKRELQLQTVAGLNGLLTEIRNHFGDTMGYELDVYPDYAFIKRADPNNNRHERGYTYMFSEWSDGAGYSIPADAAVADLSKFDVAAVTAKVPGAPQSLGMTDFKQISLNVEGLADGSLKLYIWLSDGVDIAMMDLNPDGSVKALHPLH